MKTFILSFTLASAAAFAQTVASPALLTKMLEKAEANITKFCGKGNVLEFSKMPEAHDTYTKVTAEGRSRFVFAPKVTGLAACRSAGGVILIQWTAHSEPDLDGELKAAGVTKTFFLSSKISEK